MGLGFWEVGRGNIIDDSEVLACRTRQFYIHMEDAKENQICVRRPETDQGDLQISKRDHESTAHASE